MESLIEAKDKEMISKYGKLKGCYFFTIFD